MSYGKRHIVEKGGAMRHAVAAAIAQPLINSRGCWN